MVSAPASTCTHVHTYRDPWTLTHVRARTQEGHCEQDTDTDGEGSRRPVSGLEAEAAAHIEMHDSGLQSRVARFANDRGKGLGGREEMS